MKVNSCVRLLSCQQGKPSVGKLALKNPEQKKIILQGKPALRNHDKFGEVFIRSSKSHAERLIKVNAQTLLQQLPTGDTFRITANGWIVKKTPQSGIGTLMALYRHMRAKACAVE